MKRILVIILFLVVLFSVANQVAYAAEEIFEEYYVVALTALTFRDARGDSIGTVPENDVMTVLGVDPRDKKRDWVLWNGREGSVIRTGTESLNITVAEFAKKAVTNTELNLRVPESYDLICTVPNRAEVTVLWEDMYHPDRWVVDYQGIEGSVVKSGLYVYGETNIIIVDISNQSVMMLKDGRVLCYSKVVTGNLGTNDTPKGLYSIKSMEKDAILEGPGYSTKVKYWMPFFHGYGLHDAKWRSSFGGNIYTYEGSHGCVNMPTQTAKAMFENAYVGYLVMVR